MTTDSYRRSTGSVGRRVLVAFGCGLLALLLLGLIFMFVRDKATQALIERLEISAQSRVQALTSVLAKQRAVATVLSDDTAIREVLLDPTGENLMQMSLKLERLQIQTSSAEVYLLNQSGVAVAASNWNEETSFVGSDYSFRDYFAGAIKSAEATQFALGTVSKRPGLYLSHAVIADGQPVGVVVVKVEFDQMEQGWMQSADSSFVVDKAGQVILSSRPQLRFAKLPAELPTQVSASMVVPGADWTLITRTTYAEALRTALLATGTAGFLLTLLFVATLWASRARTKAARRAEADHRYRADLERAVAERTRDLSDEMRERRTAELRLGQLQGEMEQANKLATLGQITAGVAHEVNTPLATIRLLAENAQQMLPDDSRPDLARNLAQIMRNSDRIAKITTELRGFARKAIGEVGPVSLKEALDAALLLTANNRQNQGLRLVIQDIPPDLMVKVEAVRLEQILVNLIRNAQEALVNQPDPEIRIALSGGPMVRLTITDNGPGLSPEIAARLFTPFATTKAEGLGLGLMISHEIARDLDGSLKAEPPKPGMGAVFHLELPRAE